MSDIKLPSEVYRLHQGDIGAIPGNPWVYWVTKNIRTLFTDLPKLGDVAHPCQGMTTADNVRFLRYWWEIEKNSINLKCKSRPDSIDSHMQWFPYMKGGGAVKWYGLRNLIINWRNDGEEIRLTGRATLRNQGFYFQDGVTWSSLSTKGLTVRWMEPGFLFDDKGSCGFPISCNKFDLIAILNSSFTSFALNMLNPSVSFQSGDLSRIPFSHSKGKLVSEIENHVTNLTRLSKHKSHQTESTLEFIAPPNWSIGLHNIAMTQDRISSLETNIDNIVYNLYGILLEEKSIIEAELAGRGQVIEDSESSKSEDEEEKATAEALTQKDLSLTWLSFALGNILGRFQPGTPGALGSAIYRRTDFAIGSLPEPTEEEFNELVGEPSQFAYIDEQGGRHVFSRQVEQALQKLTLPDGIAVFDPSHSRDLPTLVSKALELILGQAQAQEVIQQAAGGDLRKFLEKDFFTQHHIKQYRKRPVYWPIQSSKRSYGFVLFHEKIDRNTFYALQQEPYLPTKRRAVQLRLEELGKKVLTAQGAARTFLPSSSRRSCTARRLVGR